MGCAGFNLRTSWGVPAWLNVQARMVEGIADMMIYGLVKEIYVLRSVRILILILLRKEQRK